MTIHAHQPESTGEHDHSATFETAIKLIEHEFPLEFLIAGELAQFETYAIPSMSALLHQTGLYEQDGLKRLDDTRATMYAIFTNPEGSEKRNTTIEHLNWIHSHYDISNDDYLYTILRMFIRPLEWIEKWGWRQLSQQEIQALTVEMIKIGKAMGIVFKSEDFSELYQWQANYRAKHQVFAQTNQYVALGTIDAIQQHFPRWMHTHIKNWVCVFLDDEALLDALGLSTPSPLKKKLYELPLIGWKWLNRLYRPWKKRPFSNGWLANYYPSYENGELNCCTMGPRKLIKHRNQRSGCPFH